MRRICAAALLLSLAAAALSCRRDSPAPQPGGGPPGQCPKVEGSFFGASKSEVTRGEAVELLYKVPSAYAPSLRVEGAGLPPTTPSQPAQASDAEPFVEGVFRDVRPEKTGRIVLRADGPAGCPPLELPATVTVKEP